jgi:hypothetical protein
MFTMKSFSDGYPSKVSPESGVTVFGSAAGAAATF